MTTRARRHHESEDTGLPLPIATNERTIVGDSSEQEYRRLLGALKGAGYRVTGPRRALLRLLAQSREPLSVLQMCEAVNAVPAGTGVSAAAADEPINLVTVYRFANLLVDLKLVRRVELGQGYSRYEREEPQVGPHHHHLVCQSCGRIEDFHGCDIAPLAARLEAESGFTIERHQLEMYGTCPACRQPDDHDRDNNGDNGAGSLRTAADTI